MYVLKIKLFVHKLAQCALGAIKLSICLIYILLLVVFSGSYSNFWHLTFKCYQSLKGRYNLLTKIPLTFRHLTFLIRKFINVTNLQMLQIQHFNICSVYARKDLKQQQKIHRQVFVRRCQSTFKIIYLSMIFNVYLS